MAIGSVIYTFSRPKVIKEHGNVYNYVEKEKPHFKGYKFQMVLTEVISLYMEYKGEDRLDKFGSLFSSMILSLNEFKDNRKVFVEKVSEMYRTMSAESAYRDSPKARVTLPGFDETMNSHFVLLNESRASARISVIAFYMIGFGLLSIPGVYMFYRVCNKSVGLVAGI